MTVIEFCRRVEMFAWNEYAFEGAAIICEKMIDRGLIDIRKHSIAQATAIIVQDLIPG